MQKIAVEKVESREGQKSGKTYYKITDIKGGEFTTFDTKAAELKPGAMIEADVEVSGKYANIKSFAILNLPASTPKPPTSQPAALAIHKENIELAYKNRSTSIAYAKDLCVARIIELNQIIVEANRFLNFIESGRI